MKNKEKWNFSTNFSCSLSQISATSAAQRKVIHHPCRAMFTPFFCTMEPCDDDNAWSRCVSRVRCAAVSCQLAVRNLNTIWKKLQRDSTRWICAMKWDEIIFLKCPSFCFTTAAVSLQQAHETHTNSSINCYASSFIYIKGFTVLILYFFLYFPFYVLLYRSECAHHTRTRYIASPRAIIL